MGIEKNLADFLPSDVEAVVASERNYAARYNRQSEPRAILLAGQPGAGKTVLSSMLNKLLCGNVYFIIGVSTPITKNCMPGMDRILYR